MGVKNPASGAAENPLCREETTPGRFFWKKRKKTFSAVDIFKRNGTWRYVPPSLFVTESEKFLPLHPLMSMSS